MTEFKDRAGILIRETINQAKTNYQESYLTTRSSWKLPLIEACLAVEAAAAYSMSHHNLLEAAKTPLASLLLVGGFHLTVFMANAHQTLKEKSHNQSE